MTDVPDWWFLGQPRTTKDDPERTPPMADTRTTPPATMTITRSSDGASVTLGEPTHEQQLADLDARADRLNGTPLVHLKTCAFSVFGGTEACDCGSAQDRSFGTTVIKSEDAFDPDGLYHHLGEFEISADVKAVRGKNTSDGPALEIVLSTEVTDNALRLTWLMGQGPVQVVFRSSNAQRRLPGVQ